MDMTEALDLHLDLADYRREVAALYAQVRAHHDPEAARAHWLAVRNLLFSTHPSSPIAAADRVAWPGLLAFAYDPTWRIEVEVRPPADDEPSVGIAHSADGATQARAVGQVTIERDGASADLTVYWLDQYGGGLFLPFRDATGGTSTYGGGRYLLDGAKSADLGGAAGRLVLDFNFAYHPSCAHDPRWSCPLAPPANTLPMAVEAGERLT